MRFNETQVTASTGAVVSSSIVDFNRQTEPDMQEPSRPMTRSMASTATRRSARLKIKRRGSLASSLLPEPSEVNVHSETRKRKRASVPADEEPPGKTSRKKCATVEVHVERRAQQKGNAVATGSNELASKVVWLDKSHSTSRVKELEERLEVALQDNEVLTAAVKEHKVDASQATLKQLEDYFTCPLCFEIMACPYALIPRNCGHTFCATCILKWFFSRLHRGCGGWHEAVDCPMCRSALPHTTERTPRFEFCFPFTPNRAADIAIRGMINSISHELASVAGLAPNPLSDWSEDGHNKQEWSKRERTGRTEMTSIAAQWNTLIPTDFLNIKNRLEV